MNNDGNTLAAGAHGEASNATGINGNQDDNQYLESGAVYVFSKSGSTWAQQAYIKASTARSGIYFGRIVSLSNDGNTLVAGAYLEKSAAIGINGDQTNTSASGSGAAYAFKRSGATWIQLAYIKASNTEANDRFGSNLCVSGDGNTLAVAAVWESSLATEIGGDQTNNSGGDAGAVYLY